MNSDLNDLLKISKAVGSDRRFVQAGGGNTSVKTNDGRHMYVKASGTALGEMREGRGYRLVDVASCIALIEDEALAALPPAQRESEVIARLADCCVDELQGRPSVETSLHAALGRCVVHTHPPVVNGLLCARNGQGAIRQLFQNMEPPYLYVDYAGAGYGLARRLRGALADYRAQHGRLPVVIFLQNHGPFVTTDDADEALAVTTRVFDAVQAAVQDATERAGLSEPAPPDRMYQEDAVAEVTAAMEGFYAHVFEGPAFVGFDRDQAVTSFMRLAKAREMAAAGPLIPDQVVYCRHRPVWIEPSEATGSLGAHVTSALTPVAAGGNTPVCVIVAGLGLFCAAPTQRLLASISVTMRAVLETLSITALFGGPRPLEEGAADLIRQSEIYNFRRRLAAGTELDNWEASADK